MTYTNIQIQCPTAPYAPDTAVHANSGMDTPGCGAKLRNWTDPKTGKRHNSNYVVVDKPITCTRIGCKG